MSKTITRAEFDHWNKSQIGKPCEKHGSLIKNGAYGNWCGNKTELGTWCEGNPYPHDPREGTLIIKAE